MIDSGMIARVVVMTSVMMMTIPMRRMSNHARGKGVRDKMNTKTVKIGEYYRHADTPNYAWAKVLEVIKPHTGLNTHGYLIAKCEWTLSQNDTFGLIKYFKLSDLVKPAPEVKE